MKSSLRVSRSRRPPASKADLRVVVQKVLRGIADLMIDADLPMREFEDIAKRAFVSVAGARALRRNGTVNRSRVAAITGLSRAEVTALFADANSVTRASHKSRAGRVVDGWSTDRRFRTAARTPRVLTISNGAGSFSELVRLYAGDIPPKAILDRMERLKLVRVLLPAGQKQKRVQLLKKVPGGTLYPDLLTVVKHLSNALRAPQHSLFTTVTSTRIYARDSIQLAAISRAAEERREVFLSGLQSSFPRRAAGTATSFEVFVGIAPATPLDEPATSNFGSGLQVKSRQRIRKK